MKKAFLGLISIFICAVGYADNNTNLPPIKDPATLSKECVLLYQQFPAITNAFAVSERNIPTNDWPASIQLLHPFKVTQNKYAICIWIIPNPKVPNADWDTRGYFIHTNPNLSPRRFAHDTWPFDLYQTDYNGIDIFHRPGAVL
jgi:hypothetical protein